MDDYNDFLETQLTNIYRSEENWNDSNSNDYEDLSSDIDYSDTSFDEYDY